MYENQSIKPRGFGWVYLGIITSIEILFVYVLIGFVAFLIDAISTTLLKI